MKTRKAMESLRRKMIYDINFLNDWQVNIREHMSMCCVDIVEGKRAAHRIMYNQFGVAMNGKVIDINYTMIPKKVLKFVTPTNALVDQFVPVADIDGTVYVGAITFKRPLVYDSRAVKIVEVSGEWLHKALHYCYGEKL